MSPHCWSWCSSYPLPHTSLWGFCPPGSSLPTRTPSSFFLAVEAFHCVVWGGSPAPSTGAPACCFPMVALAYSWQGPCFCFWQELPTYLWHSSLVRHRNWFYLLANVFMVGRQWDLLQVCGLKLLFLRHVSHSDIKTVYTKDMSIYSALWFMNYLAQLCPLTLMTILKMSEGHVHLRFPPHFMDEETEGQRWGRTRPGSLSLWLSYNRLLLLRAVCEKDRYGSCLQSPFTGGGDR